METSRPVVVKRMPERMNNSGAKHFLADVQPLLNADRPQVVFDLSQVQQLDVAGVEVLLHCMRQVMRRDGDLKLAALSDSRRQSAAQAVRGRACRSCLRLAPRASKSYWAAASSCWSVLAS